MASDKAPTALRTIGEVAEDVGVATHVLRFWESKFNQIKPQKRRGRRYYRPEDIQVIIQIKDLLYINGYTIRGVQKYLADEANSKKDVDDNAKPSFAKKQRAPEMPSASKAKAVNIDLFGNLVDEKGKVIQVPKKEDRSDRDAKVATLADNLTLNDEELTDLMDVYDGLLSAKKKLEEVA